MPTEKTDDRAAGESSDKLPRFHVTLPLLRQHYACVDGYNRVVRSLQGIPFTEGVVKRYIPFAHKEPISLAFILENNGLNDTLWALRCLEGHDRDLRLFAVWCARQVQHLMPDPRSIAALDIAELHAYGLASVAELRAARDVARDVARAAGDAWAAWAACAAARDAAGDAAWAAGDAAREAAGPAGEAAGEAAWAAAEAAWAAAGAAQAEMLSRMVAGKAPWQGRGVRASPAQIRYRTNNKGIQMDNWQQTYLRADPWPNIPFAHEVRTEADAMVGAVCVAVVIIVWLCGGF